MRHHCRHEVLIALVVCVLIVSGCSFTQPSRFYTLSSLSDAGEVKTGAESDLALGVGPISLPNYTDRTEVVTRASPNEFYFAEFDRWAEPLQDVFSRVVIENLSVLLATDRVFMVPGRRATLVDRQVEIQVTRFDADVGGPAVLGARWEILDNDGRSLLVRRSTFTEPVTGEGYGAVATAMSRTVAALSREIATAIRSLPRRQ
jgi:hypothetical protein